MMGLSGAIRSVIFAGCFLLLSGCVSTDLVKTMLKDMDRLKEDNATLQQQVKSLDQEVRELKSQAEHRAAPADPGKAPADSGGDVAGVDYLAGLGSAPEEPGAMKEEQPPARLNGDEVYAQAQSLYSQGKYPEAYQAFSQASILDTDREFQARCQYWMGECMFAQSAFNRALDHFGTVFGQYGATSKAADALLKIGFTYQELNNYNGARQALNEFLQRYPDHRAVPLARERLERLAEMETGTAGSDH